jgi:hypothetical protein
MTATSPNTNENRPENKNNVRCCTYVSLKRLKYKFGREECFMVDLKIIKGTERAQGWFHLMY